MSTLLDRARARHAADIEAARALLFTSPFASDALARAEAERHLASLVALNDARALHLSDPAFPRFYEVVAPQNDQQFSNPDTYYLAAEISDQFDYRIRGRLGRVNQTTIGSYAVPRNFGEKPVMGSAGERATNETLVTDPDGRFELVLGKQRRPAQNWLPLAPGANSITIYQIHADWEREQKGEFKIEAIGEIPSAPADASEASVARALEASGARVRHEVAFWLEHAKARYRAPANTIEPPQIIQIASFGSHFSTGHYVLAEDEALILEFPAPERCDYWGLTLYNAWGEMLDFAHRQTSLNRVQATADADGRYRIVIARRDPGVANWLDASGHREGLFTWRVTSKQAPAMPSLRVVRLSALDRALPESTRRVGPEERREMLAKRRAAIARRHSN